MARTSWFNITALGTDSLTVEIFDEIGFWGVTAKDFVTALKNAGKPQNITLKLDCPGGDCNDGFTIYDAIKASGANVTVEIVGLAASMASVIMLAGNKIRIAENGRVMIHRVTAGAVGNADELDAAAKVAKQFEDRIVELYKARTGKDESAIRDWMQTAQGTWFFGQDAIDAGFADEMITGQKAKAFNNRWAAKFTMLPAALFDTAAPSSPPTNSMKAIILALAAKIGITLADNATEEQMLAGINAYTPPAQNVVIDFEDAAVKNAFAARISDATKDITAKVGALETELTSVKAENTRLSNLITHGAAGAAGGAAPVPGAKPKDQMTIAEQYAEITDPAARTAFFKKHKAELGKPSALFQSAA